MIIPRFSIVKLLAVALVAAAFCLWVLWQVASAARAARDVALTQVQDARREARAAQIERDAAAAAAAEQTARANTARAIVRTGLEEIGHAPPTNPACPPDGRLDRAYDVLDRLRDAQNADRAPG